MKMRTMKVVSALLVLCMMFSLVACGNTQTTMQKKPVNNAASDNADSVVIDNDEIPLDVKVDENNNTFIEPEEGNASGSTVAPKPLDKQNENSSEKLPAIVDKITDLFDKQDKDEQNNSSDDSSDKEQEIVEKPEVDDNEPVVTPEVDNDKGNSADTNTAPKAEYNKGVVLVKVEKNFDVSALGELEYASAEPLYNGSKWYSVKLADESKTEDAVKYLNGLDAFEEVDYDYVMSTETTTESVDVSCNPDYDKHKHHHTHKVPEGWQYATNNGKRPGGSSDVIVAVIDTGVDYRHLDLRNNIWVNIAEIANNNIDDDGNGYIDDVYGWDCVGDDNDPIDDNGHGTHVAGIIAAENNDLGGVGIAYNSKIMVLKAGNSSGYFNNSDIAEAVQYAYMNGATVINMSFGGSFISIAVEEALENAYNSCILVAAAGNDSACNNLACKACKIKTVSYPAALPYVIGVMSTNYNGAAVSSFSNYDHYPYDSIEYEVYAVGESIPSCWPGNKYASLNGTSMAAPTVSGIAALLRSYYFDREMYSSKFIQSQIVNTGTLNPYNFLLEETDDAHSVANIYEALTKLPKPAVNLYDYSIDDSTAINSANNGNGVIDAGETVHLYIALHNRGGVASNVNVSIDTNQGEGLSDPYFTFVNDSMQLSDIGTYSVRESGDQYFEIIVNDDCPNDYLVNFNIRYTYTNGMDENDTVVYEDDGKQKAQFNVSSGYHLPSVINEDTVFTNDRLYIIGENVMIPAGVTVTFEEGCRIQFYDDRVYYNSPVLTVYGTLNIAGTEDNMVTIVPNERNAVFTCSINIEEGGSAFLDYADCVNVVMYDENYKDKYNRLASNSSLSNSRLVYNTGSYGYIYKYSEGSLQGNYDDMCIGTITNSYINVGYVRIYSAIFDSNYIVMELDMVALDPAFNRSYNNEFGKWIGEGKFINNIVYTSYNKKDPDSSDNRILSCSSCSDVSNNIFISSDNTNPKTFLNITYYDNHFTTFENNDFADYFDAYADQIIDGYLDSNGNPTMDIYGTCSDITALYPHVVSVEMFNADGEHITTIGKEEIKVRVTFNRPMNTEKETYLTFGTILPFADYKINGAYVSDTVWEGTYTLKAQIENGQNFLKVENACAAEDATKVVRGEYQLYEFTIDTTAAMSMNLFAQSTDAGIELTWNQDDYDTLMGYNIYRSESKDGNYVKINPSVLLPTDNSFIDDNAEAGKTYWYTFTVVLSDFSESAPAGKVYCTAEDTLYPTVYHTPINQGYENNNLIISCTASDNMRVESVILYYRTIGAAEWKTLQMSKVNDKYSATIFGSELTLEGLEYYIEASDGCNTISKASAETPYQVVIKDATSISRIGDVDGSGSVTTKDALMLMQCLNGDLILTDDEFRRADLNGDGDLSSVEALRILQYVNGKVNSLEM